MSAAAAAETAPSLSGTSLCPERVKLEMFARVPRNSTYGRIKQWKKGVSLFALDPRRHSPQGIAAVESCEVTAEQKQRDIYEAHRHRIFSLSYYMTANEFEAERILTDTFVGAFTHTASPDAEQVDRALLAQLEQRFSLERVAPAGVAAEAGRLLGQVRKTDLEEAVRTLPARERLIFLLKDVEGYAPDRIAALLRMDAGEIAGAVFSARIRMRAALQQIKARRSPLPGSAETVQAVQVSA